jgi:hypothetical protein
MQKETLQFSNICSETAERKISVLDRGRGCPPTGLWEEKNTMMLREWTSKQRGAGKTDVKIMTSLINERKFAVNRNFKYNTLIEYPTLKRTIFVAER